MNCIYIIKGMGLSLPKAKYIINNHNQAYKILRNIEFTYSIIVQYQKLVFFCARYWYFIEALSRQ